MATKQKPPLIKFKNIQKNFGHVRALRGFDLEVHENEILGLVGDNGAGKSTLMKITTGVYQPDVGSIEFEGKEESIDTPNKARELGIEMVYQERALAPKQDASKNIFLGREPTKEIGPIEVIDHAAMYQKAEDLLGELGIKVDNKQKVQTMSGGQQQAIAIARVLSSEREVKLVIFDEPTAALGIEEVEKVLDLIKRLRERGLTIILISHRFSDIFEVTDRVAVLYDGEKSGELKTSETDTEEIVKYMVGKQ